MALRCVARHRSVQARPRYVNNCQQRVQRAAWPRSSGEGPIPSAASLQKESSQSYWALRADKVDGSAPAIRRWPLFGVLSRLIRRSHVQKRPDDRAGRTNHGFPRDTAAQAESVAGITRDTLPFAPGIRSIPHARPSALTSADSLLSAGAVLPLLSQRRTASDTSSGVPVVFLPAKPTNGGAPRTSLRSAACL